MAKTQDLRRRIRSIKNTMQLTRAMKTVSAAKLRRAQEAILRARPYANHMRDVLRSLAARANPELHPLLRRHDSPRLDTVVLTADRGLCGSFNANICRTAAGFLRDNVERDLVVMALGKKGRDFFRRRRYTIAREWTDVTRNVDFSLASEIASFLTERYLEERPGGIYVVYNEFKSALAQRPVVEQLLPIEPAELEGGARGEDYIYEPDPASLFDALLPRYVEIQVYRALLESAAAEHAARMTAMESATSNAGELVDKLTLQMNRVRQASITTEILEVVSGADALGG